MVMRRALGRFEVTCLGINAIVGAGIFALPDDLFRGTGGRSPFVFLVCALGMWPVAWCYADASSSTERTGGPYVYVRDEFGPVAGYVVGWMCYANSLFSFAAVARVAAAYLGQALPSVQLGDSGARILAGGVIATFSGLNLLGARPSARFAAAFTLAKLAALAVLVGVALPKSHLAPLVAQESHGFAGWQSSLFVALFALQGFEVTPVPAGETKDARRVMPFAILASLAGAAVLYVVVQSVAVAAYPGLGANSETPLADMARAVAPSIGFVVVWGGIVSTIGFVAGDAFGTPRYAFAMAEDGYLPHFLAYVGKKRGAPMGAILATGACAAALTVIFPARALVGISNLAVAVQYLGTCLVIGRRALRDPARRKRRLAFAIPGVIVSSWIFTQGNAMERWTAVGALSVGVVIAVVQRPWARPAGSGRLRG